LVRRKDNEDSTSQGHTSFSTAPSQLVENYPSTEASCINAMASHHTGDYIFCGKDNGSVSVYDTQRGKYMKTLYTHGSVAVTLIEWNAAREVLISSDTSSRILLHKVQLVPIRTAVGQKFTWQIQRLLERRIEAPIRQLLSSVDGEYFLVSDPTVDHLWTMHGEAVLEHEFEHPEPTRTPSQKWTTHPRYKRRIYEVAFDSIHALEWPRSGSQQPKINSIEPRPKYRVDFDTRDSGVHFVKFGENMWAAYDNNPFTRPIVWEAPLSADSDITTEAFFAQFNLTAPEMQCLIGLFKSQLVFLNRNGWICSMRIDELGQGRSHAHHFPVPHCWQSSSRQTVATVTVKGDVVIAKTDELAIVKRGLSLQTFQPNLRH
jgi:WD40 repeat protein